MTRKFFQALKFATEGKFARKEKMPRFLEWGVVLNCCFWSVFASCPSYDCVCYQDCKRRNLDLSQQQNFERY